MQARRGRARKVKAKPKEQRGKAGRDLAQFKGTGAQVIIQMPKTRRARRAPLRAAKMAQVPIQPAIAMQPRPDGLTGQQTTVDRLQNQIGTIQDEMVRLRTQRARAVGEDNVVGLRDADARLNAAQQAELRIQGELVGEQSRLRGGVPFGAPASQASAAPTAFRPVPAAGGYAPPPSAPSSRPSSAVAAKPLDEMKHAELKEEARRRGLPVSGTKAVLKQRLSAGEPL